MIYYKNKKTGHIYIRLMQLSHFIYCVHNKLEQIPENYDIHHIDYNVDNNDISNLKLLERKVHGTLHTNPDLLNVDWQEIYNIWKNDPFLTKIQIAKKLNCSRRTIQRHFKTKDIDRLDFIEIKNRWLNGERKIDLAKAYNCSRKILDRHLGMLK